MQLINGSLPAALKEPLQRETQFWSATTVLKVGTDNILACRKLLTRVVN